jgi:hypothetical protein
MSRKISRSFINGRAGAGTGGQGIKVEWDSTNDGELHWLDVDESSLEFAPDGDRGIFGSGYSGGTVNIIEYVTISSTGNGTDFGDLSVSRYNATATSNGTRGVFAGDVSLSTTIDYITIATPSNATDFGDLTSGRKLTDSGFSNYTNDRGCFAGGRYSGHSYTNIIDYVTISTTGNATDFGDLLNTPAYNGSTSNSTSDRGITAGGQTSAATNIIHYVTISSTGNATDFGDLVADNKGQACTSNALSDRGVWMGGDNASGINNSMEYVTISTTGNATDFGNLLGNKGYSGGSSNGAGDRGLSAGGVSSNVIEYITISTTGNATDFGDLLSARSDLGGTADAGGN